MVDGLKTTHFRVGVGCFIPKRQKPSSQLVEDLAQGEDANGRAGRMEPRLFLGPISKPEWFIREAFARTRGMTRPETFRLSWTIPAPFSGGGGVLVPEKTNPLSGMDIILSLLESISVPTVASHSRGRRTDCGRLGLGDGRLTRRFMGGSVATFGSSPSGRDSVPNRGELQRELATLLLTLRSLEDRLDTMAPASRANAEEEIARLKVRVAAIRALLGH